MPTDGQGDAAHSTDSEASFGRIEYLLFDSLVHHLIEKGVLTKNDALSVIQTAAEVVRGQIHETGSPREAALATLERTYSSFDALPARYGRAPPEGSNILPLRVPLHGESPRFPPDDD